MTRSLFAAQAADAASFWLLVTLIPAIIVAERNPVVVGLFALGGVAAVVIVKIGLTSFVCWAVAGRRLHPLTRAAVALATVAGVAGAFANVWALSQVLG